MKEIKTRGQRKMKQRRHLPCPNYSNGGTKQTDSQFATGAIGQMLIRKRLLLNQLDMKLRFLPHARLATPWRSKHTS